jgi:site-specific DNA-cytosine methylase
MNKGINVLSLFDGMSCGQIALDKLGIPVNKYFASEIDKYAIQVTQKNYPKTIQVGSVEFVTKELINHEIDLLIGGSPCQGFSFGGKQLNFEDPRSKLFFEFVRLKNELNPKYFLLENVRMKKEYQDVISEYMGCEPININSNLVSAGLRNRMYWTNIPGIEHPKDKKIKLNDILENAVSDKDKSYCIDANYGKGSNLKRYLHRGSRQIVFTDIDFMNEVTLNRPKEEVCNKIGKENRDKWRFLTPNECEKIQNVPKDYTDSVPKFWRYHMLGNGWTVDVIAHIFSNMILGNENSAIF